MTTTQRITHCIHTALPKSAKTVGWLLKIIIPVSLTVTLLQYWGFIGYLSTYLQPLFSLIGLPGEASIVFISSIFLSLYAPIAIIATLPLDMREITILAIMCLISHNMVAETAIQKKAGSHPLIIVMLRLLSSLAMAFIFNKILPADMGNKIINEQAQHFSGTIPMLTNWLTGTGWLALKISLIVTGLMILQNILKEFNVIIWLTKIFSPFLRIMGLSSDCTFLWLVGQILGLTYGSAVTLDELDKKTISPQNARLLNLHIAVNHSLLEDTLLFVAIGVPAGWIIGSRFLLATAVVWTTRLIRRS